MTNQQRIDAIKELAKGLDKEDKFQLYEYTRDLYEHALRWDGMSDEDKQKYGYEPLETE